MQITKRMWSNVQTNFAMIISRLHKTSTPEFLGKRCWTPSDTSSGSIHFPSFLSNYLTFYFYILKLNAGNVIFQRCFWLQMKDYITFILFITWLLLLILSSLLLLLLLVFLLLQLYFLIVIIPLIETIFYQKARGL